MSILILKNKTLSKETLLFNFHTPQQIIAQTINFFTTSWVLNIESYLQNQIY